MTPEEIWDWEWLLYVGTTVLGMPEQAFWKTTPRKLRALASAHVQAHQPASGARGDQVARQGYIDDVIF